MQQKAAFPRLQLGGSTLSYTTPDSVALIIHGSPHKLRLLVPPRDLCWTAPPGFLPKNHYMKQQVNVLAMFVSLLTEVLVRDKEEKAYPDLQLQ